MIARAVPLKIRSRSGPLTSMASMVVTARVKATRPRSCVVIPLSKGGRYIFFASE